MREDTRDAGFAETKAAAILSHVRSALLLVAMAVVAPTLAMANDIVVDGKHCVFSSAIKNHNTRSFADQSCAAGSGDDTIILDPRDARGQPEPTIFISVSQAFSINGTLRFTTPQPQIFFINAFFNVEAGASLTVSAPISMRVQPDQFPAPFASLFTVNAGSTLVLNGSGRLSNHNFDDAPFGAAVRNLGGSVTIAGAYTFEFNRSTEAGGAIYSEAGGTVRISDGVVFKNNAVAVMLDFNKISGQGGAIYVRESDLEISGQIQCIHNRARDGGCIFAHNSTVNISAPNPSQLSNFIDNEGTPDGGGRGGALTMEGGTGTITGIFDNNNSGSPTSSGCCGLGGAIYLENGSLTANHVSCQGNKAHLGGCVYVTHANFTFSDSSCLLNKALEGGCLEALGDSDNLVITNSTIGSNVAGKNARGGGMLLQNTNASITNSNIDENEAGKFSESGLGSGGGIFALTTNPSFPTKIAMSGSAVTSNTTSSFNGAGIELENSTLTAVNCTFADEIPRKLRRRATGKRIAAVHLMDSFGNFLFTTFQNAQLVNVGNSKIELRNSVFQNSSECIANPQDDGFNLQFPAPNCPTSIPVVDPKLDPEGIQADNGGPTPTVALLAGSPAINAVPNAMCTDFNGQPIRFDQRGLLRPKPRGGPNGPCDMGAFESQ